MQSAQETLEILYDSYSPVLYGIALQITLNPTQAKQILITTFTKARQQNLNELKYSSPCIALIKLLIESAHEHFNNNTGRTNFKIKHFESTPMLHEILCEQMTLENYCISNKITKPQAMSIFKEELSLLLNTKTPAPIVEIQTEVLSSEKNKSK